MRYNLKHLFREQLAAVTIEFAFWTTLIFFILLTALDIGQFTIQRGHMAEAVSGASLAAFKQRSSVDYSGITGYIRAASAAPDANSVIVSVGCNGGTDNCTNSSRTCACLSQTGSFVPAGACGQTCGTGATANSQSGYYLNISATYPYRPLFLPNGMLSSANITQRSTVRLQ